MYLLPRTGQPRVGGGGWQESIDAIITAATTVADRVILFGSDVGAAMALEACAHANVLALALFGPTTPSDAGRSYLRSLGLFRRRRRGNAALVAAPPRLRRHLWQETDADEEPKRLIDDLIAGPPFSPPHSHPPAIVFEARDDPFAAGHATLVRDRYARTSPTPVEGRWWPSLGWESVCDEVHRFLVLTLGDRVVEFPDDVLDET